MLVYFAEIVSTSVIIPGVTDRAKVVNKGWIAFAVLFFLSLIFSVVGEGPSNKKIAACEGHSDDYSSILYPDGTEEVVNCIEVRDNQNTSELLESCSAILCCSSIIVALSISFGSNKKTKTVIVQQGFIPQNQTIQSGQQIIQTRTVMNPGYAGKMPVNQQMVTSQPQKQTSQLMSSQPPIQKPQQKTSLAAPSMDEIEKLASEARNLELARDFEAAANRYQEAGLFAEAGRVRKEHLEKDKPVVQIGQIGDSVVKDSVIMGDSLKPPTCQGCGIEIQPEWKFCPSCKSPL